MYRGFLGKDIMVNLSSKNSLIYLILNPCEWRIFIGFFEKNIYFFAFILFFNCGSNPPIVKLISGFFFH